ncbi:dienelactone hydrolase family protein [Candidatus Methylacidiphilum infernorum]|uniref:dienelactone hydrolase family protein n=1 Tax=Candidatus Methylacidiphilum infernorum TaxID=511746 RepID=UPI001F5D649E|nr:dienelactone hydrolase family protein [Candidatus Methylacidiphilum infernorum]
MEHFSFFEAVYQKGMVGKKRKGAFSACFFLGFYLLLSVQNSLAENNLGKDPNSLQAAPISSVEEKGNPSVQPAEPVLRGALVKLTDFGADDVGYLSIPDQEPKGGVVLVPGKWGMNRGIKFLADRFSKEGYVALAVDLFNGIVPKDSSYAADLTRFVREDSALGVISAAVRFLHESPRFHTDKVGIVGWDKGGEYTFEAALTIKGIEAAIIYYGEVDFEKKKLFKLKVPLCYFYAEKDKSISKEKIIHFVNRLEEEKKPLVFYSFDAQDGFADPSNSNYDPTNAEAAWHISIDFLEKKFNSPKKETRILDKIIHGKD